MQQNRQPNPSDREPDELRDQPQLADLSTLGLIGVRGADAASFLQAQLSNDVMRLDESRSELAAWCDAKGRALAVFRVFRRDDFYCLLCPQTLVDTVLKRLKMFVLRADVELVDLSETLSRFAFFGPGAPEQHEIVAAENEIVRRDNMQWLALPGPVPTVLATGPVEDCQQDWGRLSELATAADYSAWQRNRILAGEPQIHPQTQGAFVPQMLNLHWLGGIDFHKGCYPGQEVVARLQYRGRLTRRLFLARIESGATPEPGETVTEAGGENLGQIIAGAPDNAGGQVLVAVLKIDAPQKQARVGDSQLNFLELPYPTPDAPD